MASTGEVFIVSWEAGNRLEFKCLLKLLSNRPNDLCLCLMLGGLEVKTLLVALDVLV